MYKSHLPPLLTRLTSLQLNSLFQEVTQLLVACTD